MPGEGEIIRGQRGKLISDTRATPGAGAGRAQEETEAEKTRKREAAWNARYFAHLGIGSGLGGAAAIDKYKTAHPDWTKGRDTWAQGVSKAAAQRRASQGASLGTLAGARRR